MSLAHPVSLLGLLFRLSAAAAAVPPQDPASYVLLGTSSVELGDGSFIANGNIGVDSATGALTLGKRVFVADGSATVAVQSAIGVGTSVFNLFTNQLITPQTQVVIRGAGPTPFVPPVVPALPAPGPFTPGTRAVIVPRGGGHSLAAGSYGDLVVKDRGILELAGGSYQFASVKVGHLAQIRVDAPSTVSVKGRLILAGLSSMGPARAALCPMQVRVNVGGSSVIVGGGDHVAFDLLAPNATIKFGPAVRGTGRFIGARLITSPRAIFRLPACGAGPVGSQFCTLTQEVYGAAGGAANGPTGFVTQHPELLSAATVGAPGILSLTIQDPASLVCFLPATGKPAALCDGLSGCGGDMVIDACGNPPILDFDPAGDGSSGGQGGGGLTGEAIAAKLNVAMSDRGMTPPGLANFLLPNILCTTACPSGREVDPTVMDIQLATIGLADGMTSVADLLALTDQALSSPCRLGTCTQTNNFAGDGHAFSPPDPTRLIGLQNALQVINECFAGCATVTPCP